MSVVLPEDVPKNLWTAWHIPAANDDQEFNLKAFFAQRGIVSKDVTKLVEKEGSRSPSDYTLYHIDFTSPPPAAPAPAAPAPVAPVPAAKLVHDERTRKRAPLFTDMEKLGKIENEFDLALKEFHAASRDLNNAMLKDDDDTVHDMFEILTVRCSAVGRKHKNMLKAVEEIKANMLEVGVMRSDLCRSPYNSYVVQTPL